VFERKKKTNSEKTYYFAEKAAGIDRQNRSEVEKNNQNRIEESKNRINENRAQSSLKLTKSIIRLRRFGDEAPPGSV